MKAVDPEEAWEKMTKLEKDERVEQLWRVARKYNNKLRFASRHTKMAEKYIFQEIGTGVSPGGDEKGPCHKV